jgi:hypothetical protein
LIVPDATDHNSRQGSQQQLSGRGLLYSLNDTVNVLRGTSC